MILIARWWKDNSPNNESWFGGARKQCEAIRSPALRNAAQTALEEVLGLISGWPLPHTRPADFAVYESGDLILGQRCKCSTNHWVADDRAALASLGTGCTHPVGRLWTYEYVYGDEYVKRI